MAFSTQQAGNLAPGVYDFSHLLRVARPQLRREFGQTLCNEHPMNELAACKHPGQVVHFYIPPEEDRPSVKNDLHELNYRIRSADPTSRHMKFSHHRVLSTKVPDC